MAAAAPEGVDMKLVQEAFTAFSKFGNSKSDGKTVTLSQTDKWMKQAKVIDGKKITTTDTAICFNKFKTKTMNLSDFIKYVEALAKEKNIDPNDLFQKLTSCGDPGTTGATQFSASGAVDRMTDTSLYTGAHKERFDASGKGKGIEGRENVADNSGYVANYKGKDTYDKKK